MRRADVLILSLGVFALPGCGTASHDAGSKTMKNATPAPTQGSVSSSEGFNPPAPEKGFTRIEAPVIEGIEPGGDVSYCQFVMGPSDHDVDILNMTGYQSRGGHHSLAYTNTRDVPVGTSRICTPDDDMQGGFLGGTGGEGTAVTLPDGVAFRLPKGSGIMLNTHFINSSDQVVDGHTVLDFEFSEVDPSRKIAAFFSNGTTKFDIPASGEATATAECVAREDMNFIFFTSHLHEFGSFGETELVPAGADTGDIIHTQDWSPHDQVAPIWSTWTLDAPLQVKKGDTFRSTCRWHNTTTSDLTFPREMCFGVGFYVSDTPASPACLDGSYL